MTSWNRHADATAAVDSITADELPAAADLLARSMRDNPLHVAVFGHNAELRRRRLQRMFDVLLPHMGALHGVHRSGRLIAVLGLMPPRPDGSPRMAQTLLALRLIGGQRPDIGWRLFKWLTARSRIETRRPRWYIGPLAVAPACQHQGLGSHLIRNICTEIDRRGHIARLETDKADNITFYENLGFAVMHEKPVLGVPNWVMERRRFDSRA